MENKDTQLDESGRNGTTGAQRLNPHEYKTTQMLTQGD